MPPAREILAAVLRSRVVLFFVLGGLLFWLAPRPPGASRIVVSTETLSSLRAAQAARDHAPLSAEAGVRVDARAVDDEILYREALRLGLERDDPVMRQHLIQKMLLLAEDLGGASRPPSEDEVRAYFEQAPSRWTMPESFKLLQLLFRDEAQARTADPRGASEEQLAERSAPFPLPRTMVASADELAASFDPGFLDAVRKLPIGAWSEPVRSRFGWHRVRLIDHVPARAPSFEEARPRVALDLARHRREEAVRSFLLRARARYRIELPDGVSLPEPERRVGRRVVPSGED